MFLRIVGARSAEQFDIIEVKRYFDLNIMLNFPILSLFAKRVLSIKFMERFWNVSTPHMEQVVHIMPY